MITYLKKSSDEEKVKYEQYVEFLAESDQTVSAKNEKKP